MNIGDRLPYPGLRAFTREESDLFFGREGSVDTMVDCLAANRFMAVLGPSGSGKSSLVRTGLLDALELGLLSAAGSHWKIADMHPGGEPIRKLAGALLSVGPTGPGDQAEIEFMTAFLRRGPRSVIEWATAGNIPPGTNLLLLVDQFEELFRYKDYAQREEAEAFVSALLESASTADASIYVVITMRSEYLGACASITGLAERISTGLYLTPRMDREQCQEAIEGPAGVLGFSVEPALVTRLINDLNTFAPWQAGRESDLGGQLARQADQLPLMQHVLNRLWLRARLQSNGAPVELKLSEYDEIGGLSGALDAHGGEVMDSVGAERSAYIESIFRSLIDGNSVATAVRRPCRMSELIEATNGRRDDTIAIVEAFRARGCNFLSTSDPSLQRSDVIVDISHESLIRQWTPLSGWLEKEARDVGEWSRLVSSQQRYALQEGGLLTGLDYQTSVAWWLAAAPTAAWARRHGGDLDAVRSYLEESRRTEESRAEEERHRRANERRRLRIGVATLAVLLCIVSGLVVSTKKEAKKADEANHQISNINSELRKTANDRLASEERVAAANRQLRMDEDNLKIQAVALKKTISDLSSANASVVESARQRDKALHEAQSATTSAENDALSLTGGLDQISDVVNRDRNSQLLGTADFRAELTQAIRENRSYIETQHRNMIGQSAVVSDDFFNANFSPPGNVPEERKWLERGYTDGLKVFKPFPADPPKEQVIADFLDDSVAYIWLLYDTGETEKGTDALRQIEDIAPHIPTPKTARLLTALAGLENLEGRYFSDRAAEGINTKESKKLAEQHGKNFLELAKKAQTLPDHNVKTSLTEVRAYLNLYGTSSNPEALELLSTACKLSDDLYTSYTSNTEVIRQHIECLIDQSYEMSLTGQKYESRLRLNSAEDVAQSALRYDPNNQALLLQLAEIKNKISDIEDNRSLGGQDRLAAKDYLVKAIKGRTVFQANEFLLRNIYDRCKLIDFGDPKVGIQFYSDIIDSLSASLAAFPKARTFAYIVGDASARMGQLLATQPGMEKEAIQRLSYAIDWLDKSGTLKNLSRDDDAFSDECGWYVQRAKLYGHTNQPDLMMADVTRMKAVCSPILEKYPFDFYLRGQFIADAANTGAAFFAMKHYHEALPYLQYASHWADKDSSELLARIYQQGLDGAPDETRAAALHELANKQTTVSFAFPVDFNGAKYTNTFILRQWPDDYPYKGIGDQAEWFKQTRDGVVDPTDVQLVQQCYTVAHDTNVSSPAYCDATLNRKQHDQEKLTASREEKQKTTYALAESLGAQRKWAEADKAVDSYISTDPDSDQVLGRASNLYHERWFRFDHAYQIDRRRLELSSNEGAAADFAEASLTVSRYDSCAALSSVVRSETKEERMKLVMTSIEFACLTGENRHDAALAAGRMLQGELSGLQKVNWVFTGTEQYVRSHRPFEAQGSAWADLFDALQKGDEGKARAALTTLGVSN